MRFIVIALLGALMFPGSVLAQGPPVKINLVRVGFRSAVADEPGGRFKVGLWAPIAVDLLAGPKGLAKAELVVETSDSEDAPAFYTVAIGAMEKNEQRTILAYSKPGNSDGRYTISIRAGNQDLVPPLTGYQPPLDLGGRLYLTLGGRVPGLQDALIALRRPRPEAGDEADKRDTWPRYAAFESDPDRLPSLALGYDAVDLMIMTTDSNPFLDRLGNDHARLQAIAGWVRQGGRLVVSVSWRNQPFVSRLLTAPAWRPPLPVAPPALQPKVGENAVKRLIKVEEWANLADRPFPAFGEPAVPVALLQPAKANRPEWEVLADTSDGRPLIAKMPYGRGSVTLVAFELDKGPFTVWEGRALFLKALVSKLEPRVPQVIAANNQAWQGQEGAVGNDLATQLHITLDKFDVPVIPFGWVALFIIIYILIVGPLDYVLLKKVFKRLEWTWITFPTVVLLVSGVAYLTAYAVKGKELKINKVDLVDFDLRTELDGKQLTKKAYAYGNSWFTILSPRIESYTIGIEPAVAGWWVPPKAPAGAVVSWLGRPEYDGPGAMGRPRAQTWSRRSYAYEADAAGLIGVPIPVWTSKSFAASWETPLPRLPVLADLSYHQEKDLKLTGTLQSFLPADLQDVWVFYQNRCYPLGQLQGKKTGGEVRNISLSHVAGQEIQGWANRGGMPPGNFNPVAILKEILFHEQVDSGSNRKNQALRRLDLSWRLPDEPKTRHTQVRDVIVFGRLGPAMGAAESLTRDQPVPTFLWLGDVPGPNKTRPQLAGTMVQDTYIRILLPARPAD